MLFFLGASIEVGEMFSWALRGVCETLSTICYRFRHLKVRVGYSHPGTLTDWVSCVFELLFKLSCLFKSGSLQ